MPKLELIICPNPKCHREIEQLIVVSDVSTIPVERYYACPHCFFKLDVIAAQLQKEKEKKRKEEPPVKPPGRKKKFLQSVLIILDIWRVVVRMIISRKNV